MHSCFSKLKDKCRVNDKLNLIFVAIIKKVKLTHLLANNLIKKTTMKKKDQH